MAYGALGGSRPREPNFLRQLALLEAMQARRGARGPRTGLRREDGRERMERRYAERADRKRLERAFDAEMQARAAQGERAERELGLKERGLEAQIRDQLSGRRLEEGRLGLGYEQLGLGRERMGIERDELSERIRSSMAGEDTARYRAETERMGAGTGQIEMRLRVLQGLYEQAVEAGDMDRAKAIQDTMVRTGLDVGWGRMDQGFAPASGGTRIGGETPREAYEGIKETATKGEVKSAVETDIDDPVYVARMIDQQNAAALASYLRGVLVRNRIAPSKQNIFLAYQSLLSNEDVRDAVEGLRRTKWDFRHNYTASEINMMPGHYMTRLNPAMRERLGIEGFDY